MNRLISHIEFLLHEHNCVIIPELGGFVVNAIPSRRDNNQLLYPPSCELVFNRDLTHNDGLLAESYMKTYDLTFESAMWKIESEVVHLKEVLRDKNFLDLDKLGSFSLTEDNRFTYKPGEFLKPEYFGLSIVKIKDLIQDQKIVPLSTEEVSSNEMSQGVQGVGKRRNLRKVGIAAASVAAIIMFMFILPVSDTTLGRQMANLSYETEWLRPKKSGVNKHTIPSQDITTNEYNELQNAEVKNTLLPPGTETLVEAGNESAYFIVMGVFRGEVSASRLIETLKKEGFTGANWLERPKRFDVYAASFNNEDDAEVYLKEVHKKYRNHSDAWILKR